MRTYIIFVLSIWSFGAFGKMSTIFNGGSGYVIQIELGSHQANIGGCLCGDCFAILLGQIHYCQTDDCKAILTKNPRACSTTDCKAFIELMAKLKTGKVDESEKSEFASQCSTSCCRMIIMGSGSCPGSSSSYSYRDFLDGLPDSDQFAVQGNEYTIRAYIGKVCPSLSSPWPPEVDAEAERERQSKAVLDKGNAQFKESLNKESRYGDLLGRRIIANGKDEKKYRIKGQSYPFDNVLYRSSYSEPLSECEEAEFKALYKELYGGKSSGGSCTIC